MAREKLEATRRGRTKKIHLTDKVAEDPGGQPQMAELEIFVQTGEYPDGRLGEIFLKADKAGSTISGLLDALSITTSLALQHGVPLETIVEKWARMQFAPAGTTSDPEMARVTSIVDAVARWLWIRYCHADAGAAA